MLSRGNILTAAVVAVVVACALFGLYEGVLASLVLLAAVLSGRVLSGKRELRRWLAIHTRAATRVSPLSSMLEEVSEASRGNLYFREQLASYLLSSYLLKNRGITKPSQRDLAEAQEELVARRGSTDVRSIVDPRRIRSRGLRGRDYVRELQLLVDMMRNG